MKANPTESLDYFSTLDEGAAESNEVDFGLKIRALKTEEEYKKAISTSSRPVVVEFYAPW